MHDYTQKEVAVNHLYQQYTMLKNAIREMGGYESDEEIDWWYARTLPSAMSLSEIVSTFPSPVGCEAFYIYF